ncbi:MAG: methylated-DNA--[protein]-cysteine S-methyltransferase [Chloroflexota bacterium]|nr:methylated-DNA--[protein]-cysteine S-methyltransferase [Chloroflexota bacterium]
MTDLEGRLGRPPRLAHFDARRASALLAQRASEAGLLDVAYGALDTPLGTLIVAVTPRGLVRIAYPGEGEERVLDELAQGVSPRVLHAPERTDAVRRELDAYFTGIRHEFDLAIDWSLVRGFTLGVLQATAAVPFGSVATYGEVATSAGSPRAARAAGNALHINPIPIVVPCHRIVPAAGGIGKYGGGEERKEFLLGLEGALPDLMSGRRRESAGAVRPVTGL